MRMLLFAQTAVAAAALAFAAPGTTSAYAAGGGVHLESQDWSFSGLFGTFDQASAQRGFQVYREVCSGCHSMNLMSYRNLEGIGLPAETVKAIAAEADKTVINDEGEEVDVPRAASDRFVEPYANVQEARSVNGGALPPDLSLMAKARANGPNYIYALLMGYNDPPEGFDLSEGMNYNAAFAGHQIAMSQPLFDEMVEYSDSTPATLDQMSRDVVTFLMFAAEPHMEERKRTGIKVVAFLFILTVLLFFVKRRVWADLH
ncbi:MAG: cytochrome c1 [Alphaproteobacteria bacterium]|jgi:ubiquinol-cytochrome c reductase cytochrome c1 subunit